MNELKDVKNKIRKVLKKNGVVKAGIFGSYARGEQKKNSDIDILIEVKGRKFSLFDLVGLEITLRGLVVSIGGLAFGSSCLEDFCFLPGVLRARINSSKVSRLPDLSLSMAASTRSRSSAFCASRLSKRSVSRVSEECLRTLP